MSQEKRHKRLGIPQNVFPSQQMEYLLTQTKDPETKEQIKKLIPRMKRLEKTSNYPPNGQRYGNPISTALPVKR